MGKINKYIRKIIVFVIIISFVLGINISKSYAENTSANNTSKTGNTTSSNTTTNTSAQTTTVKSSDATLTDLGITPNDFKGFKSNTTTYDVTVPEDTDKVEVYAKTKSPNATVQGTGFKKLENGLNTVSVIVTAEDGTKKTYTINITKKGDDSKEEKQEEASQTSQNHESIADGIETLSIEGVTLNPEFKTDIYEYTAKYVGEETKLNIKAEATDPMFLVDITGNKDLIEGENLITILVSDPDGKNIATYQIIVTKSLIDEENAKEEKTQKYKKIIIAGIIAIAIIILIIIIKHRRNKRFAEEYTVPYTGRDEDYDYEDEDDDEFEYDEEDDNFDKYEESNDIKVDNKDTYDKMELSKEELRNKFLDSYNSHDYDDKIIEEKRKKKNHHKGKRFK